MTVVFEPPVRGTRQLSHKHLLDEVFWERLISRITSNHPDIERDLAEMILNETLAFLQLAAVAKGCYSPSPKVDIGWHEFMLYTKEYAAFCQEHAGEFIHHEPFDIPGVDYGDLLQAPLVTLAAMERHGIAVDFPELWTVGAADCCQASKWCCIPKKECG